MSSIYLLRVGAPFIVGLLQIGLAVAIWRRKGGRDASNRLFALAILSIAVWAFAIALWDASPLIGFVDFSSTLAYFSASFIPYFFLLFTLNFPAERLRIPKKELFILTIPLIITLLFVLTPYQVIREGGGNVYVDPVLVPAGGDSTYGLFIVGYFLFAFSQLFRKYRSVKGVFRTQAKHILWGMAFPTCVGITADLFFPVFVSSNYFWVGIIATLWLFITVTHSMRTQRLFDLKILEYQGKLLALVKPEEAKHFHLRNRPLPSVAGEVT